MTGCCLGGAWGGGNVYSCSSDHLYFDDEEFQDVGSHPSPPRPTLGSVADPSPERALGRRRRRSRRESGALIVASTLSTSALKRTTVKAFPSGDSRV